MKIRRPVKLDKIPKYETLISLSRRFPEAQPRAIQSYLFLLKTWSDVIAALDLHYARHNISRGRFIVLITLYHNTERNISPAMIAEKVGVTRATVTGLLDGLERDGLILREKDIEDKRALKIRLTPKGKKVIEKILPDHYRRISALMSTLDDKEKEQLVALLSKVEAGISAISNP